MKCNLCQDSKEIKVEKARTIGYTLTPGEIIDEYLAPCPLCSFTETTEKYLEDKK